VNKSGHGWINRHDKPMVPIVRLIKSTTGHAVKTGSIVFNPEIETFFGIAVPLLNADMVIPGIAWLI
jgi:hypothetical protein